MLVLARLFLSTQQVHSPTSPFTGLAPLVYLPRFMATLLSTNATIVRVLGVDPGTRVAGYGVLDLTPGRPPRLVAHGTIRFPPSPLAARLEALFRELKAIIASHCPTVLAIEQIFHGKNFQSILKVGEARGVAVLAAQLAGLDIHEYTPAMIKKAATGNGNAQKVQVQRMMGRLLGMEEFPESVDASDALAAAFCHGQRAWRMAVESKLPATNRNPLLAMARRRVKLPLARSTGRGVLAGFNLAALIASGKAKIIPRARKKTAPTSPPTKRTETK